MSIQIEQISETKILIHDGATNIAEITTAGGIRVNGAFQIGTGVISTATATNAVVGAAGGYMIARSAAPVALDGSNPTPVAHGLTTCIAAFAQLAGTAAPGDSTSVLTCNINGANIDVYAWKHTTGGVAGNPTLVASTGTETFNWFAVGV